MAAYIFVAVYSAINILWLIWALFGTDGLAVFDTAELIGFVGPIIGIISLIVLQCSVRIGRFSVVENTLCILTICAWFFIDWYVIFLASAAV